MIMAKPPLEKLKQALAAAEGNDAGAEPSRIRIGDAWTDNWRALPEPLEEGGLPLEDVGESAGHDPNANST